MLRQHPNLLNHGCCLYIGLDVDIAMIVSMVVTGGSPIATGYHDITTCWNPTCTRTTSDEGEHTREIRGLRAKAIARTSHVCGCSGVDYLVMCCP
ncbi:hypothetical protein QR685DRAFT_200071 [Neurospora intermedia]|uniref:Uncharacterized protein n=1 Tax=Neurospora intermedia TaxID=5142 RepID=A0ABR3DFC9_NEUIN